MIYYDSMITAMATFHFHTNHTSISRECVELNPKIIVLWCTGRAFVVIVTVFATNSKE